jgi:cytochrome c oxidase subunit 2
VHGNTPLEIAWTIAPAVILAVIAVPTVAAIFRTYSTAPANALQVQVIGHQWWWEIQYPNDRVVTANEIHLPVNRPANFQLSSADVIHSFWVPRLAGKRDAVPGRVNQLWFTPNQADTYIGQCAEFCGTQHANMGFRVVVDPPETYQAWVQSQLAPPAQPAAGSLAAQGLDVYRASACVGCHTIQGVSEGKVGPNLTHFGSRTTIGAGIMENNTNNLRRWLRNPGEHKPGVLMPANLVPEQGLEPMIAYLMSLK